MMKPRFEKLNSKYQQLQESLRAMGSVLIAFSGGVDSTLLLKVATDTLADKALAVTARSETTPQHELREALELAKRFGAQHLIVETHELKLPAFVKNDPNKCYICKKSRFGALVQLAKERGFNVVVDGENSDDQHDYRPGTRAARELGVRSPLREAGLTKEEIRQLSQRLDLPTWNKPSIACLATRVPYGHAITSQKLKQIDQAEDFVRNTSSLDQVRVRHHGDLARIEANSCDISALAQGPVRSRIVSYLKGLGFQYVALDLEGYQTGSLNRSLDEESRDNMINSRQS